MSEPVLSCVQLDIDAQMDDYRSKSTLIEKELSALERSVEDLRVEVLQRNHIDEGVVELQGVTQTLCQIGKTVSDLKAALPAFHQKVETILDADSHLVHEKRSPTMMTNGHNGSHHNGTHHNGTHPNGSHDNNGYHDKTPDRESAAPTPPPKPTRLEVSRKLGGDPMTSKFLGLVADHQLSHGGCSNGVKMEPDSPQDPRMRGVVNGSNGSNGYQERPLPPPRNSSMHCASLRQNSNGDARGGMLRRYEHDIMSAIYANVNKPELQAQNLTANEMRTITAYAVDSGARTPHKGVTDL